MTNHIDSDYYCKFEITHFEMTCPWVDQSST